MDGAVAAERETGGGSAGHEKPQQRCSNACPCGRVAAAFPPLLLLKPRRSLTPPHTQMRNRLSMSSSSSDWIHLDGA